MKEKWFQLPLSRYVQCVGFYAFLIHSSTFSEVVFCTTSAKERNGGVGIRGKNRVVDESTPCVANMNCEGFYDGETELL
jgi:hypothetical protein